MNMWVNVAIAQWDAGYAVEGLTFKTADQDAYGRYRELMQVIDAAVLDVDTLQYSHRIVATAAMYMVLGQHCGAKKGLIHGNLLAEPSPFNNAFGSFLHKCFDIEPAQIQPAIQYLGHFTSLPFVYAPPSPPSASYVSPADALAIGQPGGLALLPDLQPRPARIRTGTT